jgi:hypothetical protein
MSENNERRKRALGLRTELQHAIALPHRRPSQEEWTLRFARRGLEGELLTEALTAAESVGELAGESLIGPGQRAARRAADDAALRLADKLHAGKTSAKRQLSRSEVAEAVAHPERAQARRDVLKEVINPHRAGSTGQVTVKAQGPPRPERKPLPRKQ